MLKLLLNQMQLTHRFKREKVILQIAQRISWLLELHMQ